MTSLMHILLLFCVLALPVSAAYQYTEVNEGGYFELNAPSSFDITFLKVTGDGLENVGFYTIADDGSTSAIQQATKTGKNSWSFGEFDAGARVGIWVSSHSGYEFTSSDYFADQGTPSINRDNGDGTFTLGGWVVTGGGNHNQNAFFTYGAEIIITAPGWTSGAPLPGTLASCIIGVGIIASSRHSRQRRKQKRQRDE
ncbi:MAG: hypothetical protein GX617_10625 [Lentisphaerae bacterium]|nr:hypothetical protein [Lentisphaerota bacterium]